MQAGYGRSKINPPIGTQMMGFGVRDAEQGCTTVHDDIYVRALYVEDEWGRSLIISTDLCFVGKLEVDVFKSRLAEVVGLEAQQILINASHTHAAPGFGKWAADVRPDGDSLYIELVAHSITEAARQAQAAARPATVASGVGHTSLPINRRKRLSCGEIGNAPNANGKCYSRLPVCVLKDVLTGRPICVLFSVSCHPSILRGFEVSAEFPGVAVQRIDDHFGMPVGLCLQGVGGDAKPITMVNRDQAWRSNQWDDVVAAGAMVAREVLETINEKLEICETCLRSEMTQVKIPLQNPSTRGELCSLASEKSSEYTAYLKSLWAKKQLEQIGGNGDPIASASFDMQMIQLGPSLRLIALEGEPVSGYGYLIEDCFQDGHTFCLGYTNGEGMYLPTTPMIDEGGYEVTSFWEYGFPAPVAPGVESFVREGVKQLQDKCKTELA